MSALHEGVSFGEMRQGLMKDVVRAAVERCAFNVEPGDLICVVRSPGILADAYHAVTVGHSRDYDEKDILGGARQYIRDAGRQSGELINAARKTVAETKDPDEVQEILSSSLGIVRLFGTVADPVRIEPFGGIDSNDNRVLNKLAKDYQQYLTFDGDAGKVQYTDAGTALIRSNGHTGKVCPALSMKMEDKKDGGQTSVFDAFAQDSVPRYVDRFVRPAFHMPYSVRRFLKD